MILPAQVRGQINSDFVSRSSPRPTFEAPEPANYNLRVGPLRANFYASIQTEYNDNINLSQRSPVWDLSIIPNIRSGFVWKITDTHMLQFNLGMGYQLHINTPSLSSVSIDPNSRIEHQITIGNIRLIVSDTFAVQVDPTSRGEISGPRDNSVINFRRLHNTSGLLVNWQPNSHLSLASGYDFSSDRSLSGQFKSLDRHDHTFNAGGFYTRTGRSTFGLAGNFSISEFDERIQNDGTSFSFGPTWNFRLTRLISFNAHVAYSLSDFSKTGTIADTSSFRGITYQASIHHTLNSRMSHQIQISDFVGTGFGSNFTDTRALQYMLNTRLGPYILLNSTFSYEQLKVSGTAGERADRYLLYLGTGYQLTKNWTATIGYAVAVKDSDKPDRDYLQNRITLDLARQF